MRIAPVPKVAGGTTIAALAAYGITSLQEYGWDIRPSLAAFVVLVVNFVVSWLIPGEDGAAPKVPLYPPGAFPDPDDPPVAPAYRIGDAA